MKKKKSSLPKYYFGGNISLDELFNTKATKNPSYIESPDEAIAENDIALARAEEKANKDPLVTGLDIFGNLALQVGSSMMSKGMSKGQGVSKNGFNWGKLIQGGTNALGTYGQSMEMGGKVGKVPIEAEGEEIVQTPDGEITELKGPSHAQGGIDLLLPEGTEIFSDKLFGPNGKTMAERKKAREKRITKLKKLYKESPSDLTLKKTLAKIEKSNAIEEESDLAAMEHARNTLNKGVKFLTGGIVEDDPLPINGVNWDSVYSSLEEKGLLETEPWYTGKWNEPDTLNSEFIERPVGAIMKENPSLATSNPIGINIENNSKKEEKESPFKGMFDSLGGATLGDMVGMAGNLTSTFGPMKNTLANRAGDQPNINHFKDFGKDGLKKLQDSKKYIAGQKDKALSDLELSKASGIKRGRNSARGVNTMRALDIATNLGTQKAEMNVYDAFTKQMQSIFSQEAQMENQQDSIVMQGEQNRDIANREDRDNYFSQMAKDITTKGTGLQKIGKDINSIKSRKVTKKILDEMFPNFKVDAITGSTKFVAEATGKNSVNYLKIKDESLRLKVVKMVSDNKASWVDGFLVDSKGKEISLKDI